MGHPNENFINGFFVRRAVSQRYIPGKKEIIEADKKIKNNLIPSDVLSEELKNKIDLLLEQADKEALSKGVNINLPAYENIKEKLKKKLVEDFGFKLEEYKKIEEELENEDGLKNQNEDLLLATAEKIKRKRESSEENIQKSIEISKVFQEKIRKSIS